MNNSSIEMLSNAIAVAIQQSATSNGTATLSGSVSSPQTAPQASGNSQTSTSV